MQFAEINITDNKIESKQFADIYFSAEDGVGESEYNFLQANHLAKRFCNTNDFYIAETGFGTGLNFLLTLKLWRTINQSSAILHYFSSEKYPIAANTLAEIQQNQPQFSHLSAESSALLHHYQLDNKSLTVDKLTIEFSDWRCRLTILLGDNSEVYQGLANTSKTKIDAWFLDGFAPSCNPQMWRPESFQALRQLSKVGTTLSSFTVAAAVKKPLLANGFSIEKRQGFGRKREMLYGELR